MNAETVLFFLFPIQQVALLFLTHRLVKYDIPIYRRYIVEIDKIIPLKY